MSDISNPTNPDEMTDDPTTMAFITATIVEAIKKISLRYRRGNLAEWMAKDPILGDGEPGFERDTGKLKIGNGTSKYSEISPLLPESSVRTLFNSELSTPETDLNTALLEQIETKVATDLQDPTKEISLRSIELFNSELTTPDTATHDALLLQVEDKVSTDVKDRNSAIYGSLIEVAARGTKYASSYALDALRSLKRDLMAAERSTATWLGSDSTSNDVDDWYYQWALLIAAAFPNWTVEWRRWEDATQDLGAPTRIQTGPQGERYMDCSTGTLSRSLAPEQSPVLTDVIDVRMKCSRGIWTVAAPAANPVGRSGNAGERAWYCGFQTNNGRPSFTYSPDGTALVTRTVNAAPVVADGAVTWIRWWFQRNDGAGNNVFKAFQSDTGLPGSWVQLGTTNGTGSIITAGVATIFNNSATRGFTVGNNAGGAIADPSMKIYEVEIRDGDEGQSVVPVRPEHWPAYAGGSGTPSSIVGSPVLTVVNGGKAGGTIEYLLGTEPGNPSSKRLAKSMRNFGHRLLILSQSHNMAGQHGDQWTARWNSFVSTVEAQRPGVPLIATTQNPETNLAANHSAHSQRMRELPGIMHRLGRGTVDTFEALLHYPGGWEAHIKPDGAGVHPDAELSQYYAAVMYAPLAAA